ncbi:hypothetical protein [Rhizobium sp. FY34]|uniref:hypothetical protein n=1 Tax=Rhizobium sp. FY34 TaxID=2562309 RepID=UPI0010C083A2|nr:hypothetical protein [Rhizobium sp. FY34]
MAHLEPETQEEEPLDPVMEAVRRKMVRLQVVSGGIMFISLMAVLLAVVYKVRNAPQPAPTSLATGAGFAVPADQPLAVTARLPTGFEIRSVSQSGSQILFYGVLAGVQKVMIFDLSVGRIVADVTVADR